MFGTKPRLATIPGLLAGASAAKAGLTRFPRSALLLVQGRRSASQDLTALRPVVLAEPRNEEGALAGGPATELPICSPLSSKLRILFFMKSAGYIRHFDSVIRGLSARGHSIQLVFDSKMAIDGKIAIDRKKIGSNEQPTYAYLQQLMRVCPNVTLGEFARRAPNSVPDLTTIRLREMRDYLRYLDPVYATSPSLRARARSVLYHHRRSRRLVDFFGKLGDFFGTSTISRRLISTLLNRLDHLIPAPPDVVHYLRRQSPDLVMVTPMLGLGSRQHDYMKACRTLGIRSCLPVASWDNLTNKGLIHIKPDRVLVWNEVQKREAVELQQLRPDCVIVTGAHTYDHWFNWQPSTTPEAFKRKIGLDPTRPYILFLGSSGFISPNEPPIVLRWAQALRTSEDELLREIGILIRPHPKNAGQWRKIDVSHLGNCVVYPREGADAVDNQKKSDYYDSMFHCSLAVGINTSGMIEAGILGKSVYTVLFDETVETQEGTLHFRHLTSVNGGLLHIARSLPEHVDMVTRALRNPSNEKDRKSSAFVAAFVRQRHLQNTPTQVFVNAIEALVGDVS